MTPSLHQLWSLVVLLQPVVINAALTFLTGELNGTTIECPPTTRFLGKQSMESPVVANVSLFTGDPCNPDVDVDAIRGRIVYLTVGGTCSYENLYDNFVGAGIVGLVGKSHIIVVGRILTMTIVVAAESFYNPAGVSYNMKDGSARHDPDLIPFTISTWNPSVIAALKRAPSPVLVSLKPDANRWAFMFSSWHYITFVRVFPTLFYIVAFVICIVYLYRYAIMLEQRFKKEMGRSPHRGPLAVLIFIWRNLAYHHSALVIKAVTSPLLAIVCSLGGGLSSAALSAPFQRAMLWQLNGVSFVTMIMSSIIWNRIVVDINKKKKPSRLMKLIIGDFGVGSMFLYLTLILSELVFDVAHATYKANNLKWVISISGLLMALLQTLMGIQFVYSAVRFQTEVGVVAKDPTGDLRLYLNRVRNNAIGLGICSVTQGFFMFNVALPSFLTPAGWSRTYEFVLMMMSLSSIFLVRLFRPKTGGAKSPSAKVTKTGETGLTGGVTTTTATATAISSTTENRT